MRCLMIAILIPLALSIPVLSVRGEMLNGADISFLPQVEAGGGVYRVGGMSTDLFSILRSHSINMVRLRLWHTPPDGHSGLAETLALAERAHAAGCGLLLDFHYSDTWADPGHQTKPSAWPGSKRPCRPHRVPRS